MTRLVIIFAAGCINNVLYLASNLSEHNIKIDLGLGVGGRDFSCSGQGTGTCSGLL